jgi:hypothetical protein
MIIAVKTNNVDQTDHRIIEAHRHKIDLRNNDRTPKVTSAYIISTHL